MPFSSLAFPSLELKAMAVTTPRTPRGGNMCFSPRSMRTVCKQLASAVSHWRSIVKCDDPKQQVQAYLRHLQLNSAYTAWLAATLRGSYTKDCIQRCQEKAASKGKQEALTTWRRYSEVADSVVALQQARERRERHLVPQKEPSSRGSSSPREAYSEDAISILEEARTKLALKLEGTIRRAEQAEAGQETAQAQAAKWKSEAERARQALFACTRKWSQKLKDQREAADGRALKEKSDHDTLLGHREEQLRALSEHAASLEAANAGLAKRVESLELQIGLEKRYGEILRASQEGLSTAGAADFFLASPNPEPELSGVLPFRVPSLLSSPAEEGKDSRRQGGSPQGSPEKNSPSRQRQRRHQRQLRMPKLPSPRQSPEEAEGAEEADSALAAYAAAVCWDLREQNQSGASDGTSWHQPTLFPYLERKLLKPATNPPRCLDQHWHDRSGEEEEGEEEEENEFIDEEAQDEEDDEEVFSFEEGDLAALRYRTPTGLVGWGQAAARRLEERDSDLARGLTGQAACCS